MEQDVDSFLAQQLDVLVARGRTHLRARASRAAWVKAASVTPFVMVAAAVGFLVWSLVAPVDLAAGLVFVGAVTAIGAIGTYFAMRPLRPIDRRAALALFDGELDLKGRMSAVDEFLAVSPRDGFRGAALHEALASVGRALATPLTVGGAPSPVDMLRHRWPYVAGAIAVLALALSIQHAVMPGERSDVARLARDAWRRARLAPATETSTPTANARQNAERAASGTGDAGSTAAQGLDSASDRTGRSSRAQPGGAGGEPSAAQDSASAGGSPSDGGSARSGSGAAKPVGAGSASAGGKSPAASSASGAEQIAAADAASSGAGSTESATRPRPGEKPASGAAGQSGSAPPPAPRQSPPQSGEGMPPGRQSRSQKGDGGSSQPGQGNGQGSDGQRSGGDEALKKSRAISGLLLAVPMQDRLIGTANPGPVESVTRRGEPSRSSTGTGAVGDRGTARGAVGRIPHRATTAQERIVLERYFRRGRPAGAAGR